ncbi:KTSC domain-containing protein [Paramicrobacterium agarici]|uniref:KTSC domain-containing protein n=1 Tax=Paramicrobacterium agarici TaxID=630514 RepID=A0A2A9DUY4_9MICO|nr:KTSC domain-containing protein [Microbacterium agarici]PFG29719.1 KTSC domain-containing protein [Microbacterium agarici]
MRLEPIESDALDAVAYDPGTRTLLVQFESGGLYAYDDVDQQLVDDMYAAQPHPWSVVGERVKAHSYRKLT